MIGRFLAFVLGTLLGVFLVLKVRDLLRRATPEAVAERVGERVTQAQAGLGERVAEFTETFTTAMHEREAELREALGMDEGETEAAAEAGAVGEPRARRAAGR
ncbi:hypothetical protein GC722_07870 [Auraticoccus sp. F435]|uniref:Uncharacterized protein n=1 Tax=Auraticoccus cholistanensis TaxID=2656650 RepID=A0A6A9UTG4_9ACTN|nr:hypothetical protein [Auraticoccus cholistanensis]MVA75938.1 hypothetical protein [Auraticoccus cholistanensis]